MPLYTEPDEEGFRRLQQRHIWFSRILEIEYGERDAAASGNEPIPAALDWLSPLPVSVRYDFDEVECSLAYEKDDRSYACTVWDVSGEDDLPWAVFIVDDAGAPRLLPEYSVLDNDADEETLEETLRRAAEELPDRLLRGDFNRVGASVPIPGWLKAADEEDESEDDETDEEQG